MKGRRADTDVALAAVMQRRLEGHGFEVEWCGAEKRRKRRGAEGRARGGVVYNERGKERRSSSDDDGGWDTQVRGKEKIYMGSEDGPDGILIRVPHDSCLCCAMLCHVAYPSPSLLFSLSLFLPHSLILSLPPVPPLTLYLCLVLLILLALRQNGCTMASTG